MAGLQRSAVSFRRQGSSGLVWDVDKIISEELNRVANAKQDEEQQQQQQEQQQDTQEQKQEHVKSDDNKEAAPVKPSSMSINNTTTTTTIERSRSNGGGGRGHRTGRVSPAIEPPSPRVSACGFCSAFSNKPSKTTLTKKSGKRRSVR